MTNKVKIVFTIFILLFISSCGPYWYKPQGKVFKHVPKNGTPGFKLGWMHGCESGFATQFGGSFYTNFYQWKKDPDIISSDDSTYDERVYRLQKRYPKELRINWANKNEVKKNFSDYKKIFWSAHIYCRHTALGTHQSAGMDPPLADEPRYQPGKHHLGSIYKMDGHGDTRWSAW